MNLSKTINVNTGSSLSCLYPKHGRRNINTRQRGKVVGFGNGSDIKGFGPYVTIKREDGSYRTLSLVKMIRPIVE